MVADFAVVHRRQSAATLLHAACDPVGQDHYEHTASLMLVGDQRDASSVLAPRLQQFGLQPVLRFKKCYAALQLLLQSGKCELVLGMGQRELKQTMVEFRCSRLSFSRSSQLHCVSMQLRSESMLLVSEMSLGVWQCKLAQRYWHHRQQLQCPLLQLAHQGWQRCRLPWLSCCVVPLVARWTPRWFSS